MGVESGGGVPESGTPPPALFRVLGLLGLRMARARMCASGRTRIAARDGCIPHAIRRPTAMPHALAVAFWPVSCVSSSWYV